MKPCSEHSIALLLPLMQLFELGCLVTPWLFGPQVRCEYLTAF
ncbi:rCG51109 [Rattus norvegicus]|uniref:RCG51109 n=1 Tax=Rattus norvegicus TaxID=10116 RepID=A6IZG2_RAT|nr:rCG51109 [Rattus norvegicus]